MKNQISSLWLTKIDAHIDNDKYDYAFVFVDDGSTDNICIEIKNLSEFRENICQAYNFLKELSEWFFSLIHWFQMLPYLCLRFSWLH